MTGQYRGYFIDSLKLSAVTAVLGGLIGTLLALVVVRLRRPRWLRTACTAFAGVAANMGGILLAFAFIAALGTQGLTTKMLTTVGIDLPAGVHHLVLGPRHRLPVLPDPADGPGHAPGRSTG